MVELAAGLLERIAERRISLLLVEKLTFEGSPDALKANADVRKEWLEL